MSFMWRTLALLAYHAEVSAFNFTISGTLSLTGPTLTDGVDLTAASLEALQGLEVILELQEKPAAVEHINLDIRDDAGDTREVHRHYSAMLQDARAALAQPAGAQPVDSFDLRVFLGPISSELAEVAANLTSTETAPLMLPFTSLAARQMQQGNLVSSLVHTWIYSLEVQPELIMKPALEMLAVQGAKSLAIWEDDATFYSQMCAGAAQSATQLGMKLVYRHRSTDMDNMLEDLRQVASQGPNVLVVCADYKRGVEVMMAVDFLHFNPQAILMWDSQRSEFSEALLVSSALNVISPEVWSPRIELCTTQTCGVTRAAFAAEYQRRHGVEPSLYAAQAAAAALAMTFMVYGSLSDAIGNLPVPPFSLANQGIAQSLLDCGAKASFYQELCFDSYGFLVLPTVGITQLVEKNLTDDDRRLSPLRELQGDPNQVDPNQGLPGQQGPGGPPGPVVPTQPPPSADPISTATLLAYAQLTPQLLGVYRVSSTSSAQTSSSAVVFPRTSEDQRKLTGYPCEPGFEVVASDLFKMLANVAANATGLGPDTPCSPCSAGSSRNPRSPQCEDCLIGTQATSQGQSECTDCLRGTVCSSSNSTLVVARDFFYLHGLVLRCTVAGRCLGENQCLGNSAGDICLDCKTGLFPDPSRSGDADPCRPCEDEWATKSQKFIVAICFYMAAFAALWSSHLNACFSLTSTSAHALRSLVGYLHFTAITVEVANDRYFSAFVPNVKDYFITIVSLVLDPFTDVPLSCVVPGLRPYQVKVLLGTALLPAIFVTCSLLLFTWEFIVAPLLFQTCCGKANLGSSEIGLEVSRERSHADTRGRSIHHTHSLEFATASRGKPSMKRLFASVAEASMIWYHLLLPMSLYNMLGALICIDPQVAAVATVEYPRPVTVVFADPGLLCNSAEHQPWMILGIAGLVIHGLAIPSGLLVLIHSSLSESWLSQRAFGYFLHGLRPDFLYAGLVMLFVTAASVLLAGASTLPLFVRLVGLLIICCVICLTFSASRPFDERDRSVLLKLEVTSMASHIVTLAFIMLASPWAGSSTFLLQLAAAMEAVLVPIHAAFLLMVLWTLLNNAVAKRIRYCPDAEDLWGPERWLHGFLDFHSDKVTFDVATQVLDISALSRASKANLQATLKLALEHYFEASSAGAIPWLEVGCEADFEEAVMDEEEGSKGLLHLGFLSAALREMLVEVEVSRLMRHEMMRQERSLSTVIDEFRKWMTDAQQEEGPAEEVDLGTLGDALDRVKKKHKFTATTEELYMAAMLLVGNIESGHIPVYDMKLQEGTRREEVKLVSENNANALQVCDADKPMDEFLEELSATTRQPEDGDGDCAADYFEVPETETAREHTDESDDRPLPELLQKKERSSVEANEALDADAVLANTLGLHSASAAQAEYCALQEEHDGCFSQIFELKAEIQDLRRRTVEAQAELAQLELEQHNLDHVNSNSREHSEMLNRGGSAAHVEVAANRPASNKMDRPQDVLGLLPSAQPKTGKTAPAVKKSPRTAKRLYTLQQSAAAGYVAIEVEDSEDASPDSLHHEEVPKKVEPPPKLQAC